MNTILRGARPDHIDVNESLEKIKNHKNVKNILLAKSDQEREIYCSVITNTKIDGTDKQHVMIISGQHGSEESGRSIALGFIDFLLSEDSLAKQMLDKIEFAIVPSCNPDGAQLNTYKNSKDVDIAHIHEFDKDPVSPDGLGVWNFAKEFKPELFIDIHGLAGGSMYDRVWMDAQHNFSTNHFYMTKMGEAATLSAEKAGFPCCETKTPEVLGEASKSKRLGEKLSYLMSTLSFGVEAIEQYYTIKEWVPAGLARLKTLVQFGLTDEHGLGFSGFSNALISGNRICGLLAYGKNASERRESRIALTQLLKHNFVMIGRNADGVIKSLDLNVFTKTKNFDNVKQYAVITRIKKPFKTIAIELNKKPLAKSDFQQLEEPHSTTFIVPILKPITIAEDLLQIKYESPYL